MAGLAAALIFGAKAMQKGQGAQPEQDGVPAGSQGSLKQENAVLVFGSTGKMGSSLVQQVRSCLFGACRNNQIAKQARKSAPCSC